MTWLHAEGQLRKERDRQPRDLSEALPELAVAFLHVAARAVDLSLRLPHPRHRFLLAQPFILNIVFDVLDVSLRIAQRLFVLLHIGPHTLDFLQT